MKALCRHLIKYYGIGNEIFNYNEQKRLFLELIHIGLN